jgi:hypothetical protein
MPVCFRKSHEPAGWVEFHLINSPIQNTTRERIPTGRRQYAKYANIGWPE